MMIFMPVSGCFGHIKWWNPAGQKIKKRRIKLFMVLLALAGILPGMLLIGWFFVGGDYRSRWPVRFKSKVAEVRALSRPVRLFIIGDSFLAWWSVEHYLLKDLERFGKEHGISYRQHGIRGGRALNTSTRHAALLMTFKVRIPLLFSIMSGMT
jgi:hypothetical protein